MQAGSGTNELVLNIPFYMEYEQNGFMYRGHPSYHGAGAYYDWAHVQW
jgi:hypothetical protein